ncbi:hypothetical protein Tco_1282402 [Tanacetum coccineum]
MPTWQLAHVKWGRGEGEGFVVGLQRVKVLEALKDSPLELIMSILTLEGGHGDEDPSPDHEILLSDALASSRDHAKRRKAFASSSSAVGGMSATIPSPKSTFAVADYQISSLVIADGAVPSFEPHDDLFDSTILDKPVDS